MGYLDRLMQAQGANVFEAWKLLNEEPQLAQILETSKQKPVVIFKHSTTCGISEGAKHSLIEQWDFSEDELDFYYLDLLKYRPISNLIADELEIRHQSPQVLLIKDGKVTFHTSHHRISVKGLRENL